MHEQGFRGPQVCKVVGITYRQLDYWARTDLIRPSIADATGSGSQRVYSYRDLVELKVVKSLRDAGIALQTIRRVIEYLREELGEDIGSAHIVVDGERALLVRSDGELIDLIKRGQGVLNVVAMASVLDDLRASLADVVDLEDASTGGRTTAAVSGDSAAHATGS